MLAPLLSPVPAINIEFAVEQLPFKEPSSPFDKIMFTATSTAINSSCGQDSYRSTHLLPPPVHSPKDHTRPSPVQVTRGQGLDPTRFEALRMASRNGPKADLRKELAIRAHQSKQIERRNLFLSKIEALPSPTAASLPVTPPESPAVFHFTLPSPGLVSPLALFETLDNGRDSRPVRIEQVDFRSLARKEAEALAAVTGNMKQSLQVHGLSVPQERQKEATKPMTKPMTFNQSLPSLDQITKRLGGNVTISRAPSPVSRLPAFLQKNNANAASAVQEPAVPAVPVAKLTPTGEHGPIARPTSATGTKVRPPIYPGSVTLPGPRIASTRVPTPLTAEALNALAFRAERGSAMVERLQRRFSAPARMTQQSQSNPRTLARPFGGF